MHESNTPLTDSSSPHPSQGPTDDALASTLASAFPAPEAPEEAIAKLADVPPDPRLLAAAPAPCPFPLEELIKELAARRVLYIRAAAAIPLAAIVSIGGALLLHMLVGGGFILALFLGARYPLHARRAVATVNDAGGPGYMIQTDAAQGNPTLTGDVEKILAHSSSATQLPALPQVRDVVSTPTQLAQAQLASRSVEPPLIGVPSGRELTGVPKPRTAPHVPSPAASVVVAPPNPASQGGGVIDDSDVEGPSISLFKPGKGGDGRGQGNKSGNGIDRGGSGANNPTPSVLDAPALELPQVVRLNPPRRKAVFEVVVLTNGKPGDIRLTQSCGEPDIDALCLATIRRYKFRPAYIAGKPVDMSMDVAFSFGTSDE